MLTATAATAAALAVLLLLWPSPRLPRADRPHPWWPLAAVLLLGAAVAVPASGALSLVAAGVTWAVAALLRRRARRRAAVQVAGRVLETCELLAGELASGQPPGRALDRAATSWPRLRPVAEAHELGGDVPGALRELAGEPGARDLRLLAAAWVVAHRTGDGLADAVRRCADSIRQQRGTRRLVEGELASARATARLVAALPLLALLMGSGSGGDPFAFLLGTGPGLACLAGGLVLGFAGLWWIESIADAADPGS